MRMAMKRQESFPGIRLVTDGHKARVAPGVAYSQIVRLRLMVLGTTRRIILEIRALESLDCNSMVS